ncbi:hypothetical protein [Aquisphaera giovannonii]|uniref:hypothetical protein n=1 Tax=Aquisphaera giovannonii TaxID=406548 RepID=UPI0011E0229C|nr:hypothetical protein [Aquisphaera giovannonii]
MWTHWSDIQNQWAVVLAAFWTLLGAIVTLASMITPLTKTPEDDKIVDKLKGLLHQFSVTNPRQPKP